MTENQDESLLHGNDHTGDDQKSASELDTSQEKDDVNRRKALRAILSASTLVVINPFLIGAESKELFMTVTPSSSSPGPTPSSSTPAPTPSTSVTPSTSTPAPTPSTSVTPSSSLTPTPSTSVTPSSSLTPTPSTSVTPSSSLTPTPSTSVTPSSSLTPTPSISVTPSSSLTPTPSTSVTPSSSLTPTPSTSVTPSSSPLPTPTPSSSLQPLPVEISEFGVREEEGVIKLYWKTEAEQNNRGFEVQRSTNTILFNKMGWVDGAGNATRSQLYSFEEINVESNQWYYYRLKQIDFNGTGYFSKTVAIMINEEAKTTVKDISPTIIRENFVNVDIVAGTVDTAELLINNLHGQLVARKTALISKGNNTVRIALNNVSSGLYFVQVKFGKGKTQTKRFVVER